VGTRRSTRKDAGLWVVNVTEEEPDRGTVSSR
jgi:hypothetical protein